MLQVLILFIVNKIWSFNIYLSVVHTTINKIVNKNPMFNWKDVFSLFTSYNCYIHRILTSSISLYEILTFFMDGWIEYLVACHVSNKII